jgi:hypothetical protein
MRRASIFADAILSWLALAVGTIVGHGIAFGMQGDSD